MAFRADRPHNDLPGLPPAQDIETRQVLRACQRKLEAQTQLVLELQLERQQRGADHGTARAQTPERLRGEV